MSNTKAPWRCVPDFLCIGAARCGTTWLYEQLRTQEGVWLPPVKEVHYFDRAVNYNSPNKLACASATRRVLDPRRWNAKTSAKFIRDLLLAGLGKSDASVGWWLNWYLGYYDDEWYSSIFKPYSDSNVVGEVTPAYGILSEADIRNMYSINPELKLVYLLRNPVSRDWSSIRKSVDRGHLTLDLNSPESIEQSMESSNTAERSDYLGTIRNYLQVFPAEQVLIGFYDAIKHDPQGLLTGILDFIGLSDEQGAFDGLGKQINSSPSREIPASVHEYLYSKHAAVIADIQEILGSYSLDWGNDKKSSASSADGIRIPIIRGSLLAN